MSVNWEELSTLLESILHKKTWTYPEVHWIHQQALWWLWWNGYQKQKLEEPFKEIFAEKKLQKPKINKFKKDQNYASNGQEQSSHRECLELTMPKTLLLLWNRF